MPRVPARHVEFWYEFASTYSYPAALRIETEAKARGVRVLWRPFLLGPIFAAQAWDTSPFNIYKPKGAYMWRDLERICADLGAPFVKPDPFPQNSLRAARIAHVLEADARRLFSGALYVSQFSAGRDISATDTLTDAIRAAGENPEPILARIETQEVKNALRQIGLEAQSRGIFGAPSFIAGDGELFWGNDRMEAALDWAAAQPKE